MFPVTASLVGVRLAHAGGRHLAVVAALAVAAVIPVVVAASAATTANAALGRGLAALPTGERSAVVSYNGLLDPAEADSADALVRRQLPALVSGPIRRQVEFRALADNAGRTFTLAGTDGLASAVRITDGRLPRSCTPTACEVVVTGAPDPVLRSGFGLVVVGHAVRTDPLLLTGTFDPGPDVPLVLADGVDAVAAITPLSLIQRTYGWAAPLDRAVIRGQGVDAWAVTATRIADALASGSPGLALVVPDAVIRAEAVRARDSAQRFGLLAGSCAVLLLGAALVGGAALRPDHLRFTAALRRRGMAPGPVRVVVAGEALTVASAAAVAGLLAGGVAAAGMAASAGLPAVPTALHAVLAALPSVAGLGAAAFALLTLMTWPAAATAPPTQQRTSWRLLSGTVVLGLLAVLLVISRGAATTSSASQGGGDPLLVLLPALVLLTLGAAAARAWPWAVRAGYRVLPRDAVGARLGVAGIAARPLMAAATVALLAAAVGAGGFAASYRSTLMRGAADQAAFAVPLDARLMPGEGLRPVLSVAPAAAYAGLAPGAVAVPVLRQAGSLRSTAQQAEVVQFLGLDPTALPRLRLWSHVVDGGDPRVVARAIAVPAPSPGHLLPAGRTLRLTLTGAAPPVVVTAWLQAPDGREAAVPLAHAGRALTGPLPPAPGPWSLTALALAQSGDTATQRQHNLGEGDVERDVPAGRIGLGAVDVDRTGVPRPWAGWSGNGLRVGDTGSSAVLDYRLTDGGAVVTAAASGPGLAASGTPLPVAADPLTAARGPLLTLTLNGTPVQARVVATLPRFPTVTGRFVVADRSALAALADASTPGAGQPGEVWLSVDGGAGAVRSGLAAPPFTGVGVTWAADVEQGLRSDPVARGALALLSLAAALTMLVALAAVVLLVVAERVEDADELYTWEANGVSPASLRQSLFTRAVLVAALAVPAGVAGGLVLTRLTARLVDVTADAGTPQPPLVPVTGLGTALAVVAAGLVLALGGAGWVGLRSFRESLPVPASGPGRHR